MSLLDKINQRNAEADAASAQEVQAQEAEAAKPNAVETANGERANYSQFIANGSRVQMQEEQASPEEQAMFTELEKEMAEIVYGQKASNQIIKAVQGSADPVDGVAAMAHDVVKAMDRKRNGIDPEVLMGLGESAVEQIVDLVESASPDIDLTETQMAEAFSIATTKWRESHPEQVDGDMMNYMASEAPSQLPPGMGGMQQASPMQTLGGANG